jgi:hypothetical protein
MMLHSDDSFAPSAPFGNEIATSTPSHATAASPSDGPMRVIESELGSWALLAYKANYYLDVRCEMGPYRLHLLIKLDHVETSQYVFLGRVFVESLTKQIRMMPQYFYNRNEPIAMQQLVAYAIAKPRAK